MFELIRLWEPLVYQILPCETHMRLWCSRKCTVQFGCELVFQKACDLRGWVQLRCSFRDHLKLIATLQLKEVSHYSGSLDLSCPRLLSSPFSLPSLPLCSSLFLLHLPISCLSGGEQTLFLDLSCLSDILIVQICWKQIIFLQSFAVYAGALLVCMCASLACGLPMEGRDSAGVPGTGVTDNG